MLRTFDLLLVLFLGAGVLGLWFEGRQRAAGAQAPDAETAGIMATGIAGALPELKLPGGLRVDPATGLIMGITLPEIEGVEPLPWELLRTYEYRPGLEGMPGEIQKLDGRKVVMIGFVMTLFEYDDIKDFHLVANHWSCCYGVPPGLDGAVRVKLASDQPGLPNTIKPVRVIGTLRVKEIREDESEIVWAIYSIDDGQAKILDY